MHEKKRPSEVSPSQLEIECSKSWIDLAVGVIRADNLSPLIDRLLQLEHGRVSIRYENLMSTNIPLALPLQPEVELLEKAINNPGAALEFFSNRLKRIEERYHRYNYRYIVSIKGDITTAFVCREAIRFLQS